MIPGGARLKLGAGVNIGNNETFRVEVEADCRTGEDVAELHTFLDAELAKIGRGDLEIGSRVDAYRNRVLGPLAASTPADPPGPQAQAGNPQAPVETSQAPAAPAPTARDLHVPSSTPAAPAVASPKAVAKPAAGDGPVCEVCGTGITAAQEKSSRLFVSRVLCKACLNDLNSKVDPNDPATKAGQYQPPRKTGGA